MTLNRQRTFATMASSQRRSTPQASAPAHRTPATHYLGNQAVQALLRRGAIQAKLTVSQPRDPHEREADRVAEAVVRAPAPSPVAGVPNAPAAQPAQIQRLCAECKEELQRQPAPGAAPGRGATATAGVLPTHEGGHPLPSRVRSFFEPRFGRDFSQVRVHTDTTAAESARSVGALAYAFCNHLVFGAGQFQPETESGRKLLAHELTHTLQQPAQDRQPLLQRVADEEGGLDPAAGSGQSDTAEPGGSTPETVSPGGDTEPEEMKEGGGCVAAGRLDYPRGIRNRDTVSIWVGKGCSNVSVTLTAHWECEPCVSGPTTYRVALDGVAHSMQAGNSGAAEECSATPAKTSTATFPVKPGNHTLTITAGADSCRLVLKGSYQIKP